MCIVNVLIDGIITETFNNMFQEFILPSAITSEVTSVRSILAQSVEKYLGAGQHQNQNQIHDIRNAGQSTSSDPSRISSNVITAPRFSASNYFFVSSFVARAFPDLIESRIIAAYQDPQLLDTHLLRRHLDPSFYALPWWHRVASVVSLNVLLVWLGSQNYIVQVAVVNALTAGLIVAIAAATAAVRRHFLLGMTCVVAVVIIVLLRLYLYRHEAIRAEGIKHRQVRPLADFEAQTFALFNRGKIDATEAAKQLVLDESDNEDERGDEPDDRQNVSGAEVGYHYNDDMLQRHQKGHKSPKQEKHVRLSESSDPNTYTQMVRPGVSPVASPKRLPTQVTQTMKSQVFSPKKSPTSRTRDLKNVTPVQGVTTAAPAEVEGVNSKALAESIDRLLSTKDHMRFSPRKLTTAVDAFELSDDDDDSYSTDVSFINKCRSPDQISGRSLSIDSSDSEEESSPYTRPSPLSLIPSIATDGGGKLFSARASNLTGKGQGRWLPVGGLDGGLDGGLEEEDKEIVVSSDDGNASVVLSSVSTFDDEILEI